MRERGEYRGRYLGWKKETRRSRQQRRSPSIIVLACIFALIALPMLHANVAFLSAFTR